MSKNTTPEPEYDIDGGRIMSFTCYSTSSIHTSIATIIDSCNQLETEDGDDWEHLRTIEDAANDLVIAVRNYYAQVL